MAFVIQGETGARGGSRTHMRKNPRRILSPQRLPCRHPGIGSRTKLTCRPRTLKANESGSRSILNPEFPLVFYRGLLSGATRRAYGWLCSLDLSAQAFEDEMASCQTASRQASSESRFVVKSGHRSHTVVHLKLVNHPREGCHPRQEQM